MPNQWRTIISYTKFDFTVDEGKERLNSSREKNRLNSMHRRRKKKKVDRKSCVIFWLQGKGKNMMIVGWVNSIINIISDFSLNIGETHRCMHGHTYSKSMDQPGKVANPARGQLNREN